MEDNLMERTVDFLLSSPDKNIKYLYIYGGEPLLERKLLKRTIEFARYKEKYSKNNLKILVATNGLLLDKDYIGFFKNNKVIIALSIDGDRVSHNANRIFLNKNNSSYDILLKKIELLKSNLTPKDFYAIFTIHPKEAYRMYTNFRHLLSMKFINFHIEPAVFTVHWSSKEKKIFLHQLNKIMLFLFTRIRETKDYFFIIGLSRRLSGNTVFYHPCPLTTHIQVRPDGEMGLFSYLLFPDRNKKLTIGNIAHGLNKNFINCEFNKKSDKCKYCWNEYGIYKYVQDEKLGFHIYDDMANLFNYFVRSLTNKKLINSRIREYMQESKSFVY